MLINKATNGETKMKVFFRRAREAGQLEVQMQADYQYRQSLMCMNSLKLMKEMSL
ncbi:hypothetical protein [Neobacillus drentensis]|uniref:hypothetical protein n=1 Tax=Neobacillus drentensis TaxID=220684 RepID=UPI002FFD887F